MNTERQITHYSSVEQEHVSLCEVLDRILTKGVVVVGEVVITVADIDLIYLGLQLVLTSVETAQGKRPGGMPASEQACRWPRAYFHTK